MMLKNNFSFILILFISLVNAREDDSRALNFCFNATFEGETLRPLHQNYYCDMKCCLVDTKVHLFIKIPL